MALRDMIYESTGKARDYSHLALNLFAGCSNACLDCWAPTALRVKRDVFSRPKHRKHLLASVAKYAPNYANTHNRVLMCFSCDPYPELKDAEYITGSVMAFLGHNKVPFQILTKSGVRAIPHFPLYGPNDAFASTLTFVDPTKSRHYEPGAALPDERIATLKEAHRRGIHTWASIEPVRDVGEALAVIELSAPYVDLYKLGRWNYVKEAAQIDWRDYGRRAIKLLNKLERRYFIKADLAKHLNGIAYKNTDNRKV